MALRNSSLHAVSDRNGTPAGTLSIGANEGTFLYVLPTVFAKYHREFPKVRISVYRSFTHKVTEKVEEGAVDLGVVPWPVKSPTLEVPPAFRHPMLRMEDHANPSFARQPI